MQSPDRPMPANSGHASVHASAKERASAMERVNVTERVNENGPASASGGGHQDLEYLTS